MRKLLLLIVLGAASGCVDTAESLRFEILSVETEAVDCLMKVVDDKTADDFNKLYHERLKARKKELSERLTNMRKVMEKKEKEADNKAFEEDNSPDKKDEEQPVFTKNVRYFEYKASLEQRRAHQVRRIQFLHEEAKKESEDNPGFDELKKSDYGKL
jgi:hypothetical protein